MSEERRRSPRITLTAWAHVSVTGESRTRLCTVSDISRVGLGIQSKEALPPGSLVTIEIKFIDATKATVSWKTSGTVVRCAETEHGYFIGVDLSQPITPHHAPELDAILAKSGA